MKEKIQRFMYGRYGMDQLNKFLMGVCLVLLVISIFVRFPLMNILVFALLILMYFRMFSRQIYNRAAENTKYMNLTGGIRRSLTGFKTKVKDKDHNYYTCPNCKQTVRVPRGKGKIEITCPKCKTKFVKKT